MISTLRIPTIGRIGTALAALVLALAAPVAWAQGAANAVESINFSQVQGGKIVVKVGLREPLAATPQGFAVTNPPRIAIDLPNTVNALNRNQIEAGEGDLRSVSIVQTANRTRLVMNLSRNLTYTQSLDGRQLLVTIDASQAPSSGATVATTPSPATVFAEAPAQGTTTRYNLRDVDFRRGPNSEGRIVVDLSSANTGIDIRQQGRQLVLDFINTNVPRNLVRRLDVGDFGTPVRFVDTFEQAGNARMVIEPRGLWEYSAYQTDTQFIVEVKPVKEDPNRLVQSATPGYAGEKLSLNFQNVEVRAVLQVIADFTNFNIVTSDSVTGGVTLRLKDVPWDQALDIILQAKNLGLRKSGNVILIAPKDELNAKEKIELEAKQQIASLEPLRNQAFQLNYAKAEDITKGLTGQSQGSGGGTAARILSSRGSVVSESRTNQLFVSDIPSKLEEISSLIAKIDIPVRQVLIESRLVVADETFGRSLGIRLGAVDLRGVRGGVPGYSVGGGNNVAIGGNMNAVGSQTLQNGTTSVNFADTTFVNLPATGANGFDPATFALSLFGVGSNRFLNLEISALEADGKGKVVSSPRVITADQQKALIEQGEELPYQVATSSGATSLQFRKANLKLEVTPQVTPEGNVILDVDVTKDSVGRATSAGFAINTKHVKTQVLVENGGTVVIGGIFEQLDREDVTKVPWLGDLPYLGYLFKTKTLTSSKTELLIFLTPKVITDRTAAR